MIWDTERNESRMTNIAPPHLSSYAEDRQKEQITLVQLSSASSHLEDVGAHKAKAEEIW